MGVSQDAFKALLDTFFPFRLEINDLTQKTP